METIIIRNATIDDAIDIYYLNTDDLGYSYDMIKTRDALRAILKSTENKVFVSEVKGMVVGYIHANSCELLFDESRKCIKSLVVNTKYREKGIGRKLVAFVEKWAREENCMMVNLKIKSGDKKVNNFYKSIGYEKYDYNDIVLLKEIAR